MLFWASAALFCLTACNESDFIPVYGWQQPKPVIHGTLETDSVAKITIEAPAWVSDPAFPAALMKAEVFIIKNGVRTKLFVDSNPYVTSVHAQKAGFRANNLRIDSLNSHYDLEVNIPGFGTHTASSPGFVSRAKAHADTLYKSGWFYRLDEIRTYHEFKIELSIRDIVPEQYFLVSTLSKQSLFGWTFLDGSDFNVDLPISQSWIAPRDDSGSELSKRFPYSIFGFKGSDLGTTARKITLSVLSPLESGISSDLIVIYEVERSVYEYFEALNFEARINTLPLSEPVQIPMNISGAVGVFGRVHPILNIPFTKAGRDRLAGLN
jgi:hypothetical protein